VNKLKTGLCAGIIAAGLAGIGYTAGKLDTNNRLFGIDQEIQLDDGPRTLPVYSLWELGDLMCAAYGRKSAEFSFEKKYNKGHAWTLNENNKVSHKINDFDSLEKLIETNKVTPGDLIGTYNPHSNYNDRLDETGKEIEYTHILVYFGNVNKKPVFSHFYGSQTLLESTDQLKKRGLSPREVIVPKN
jgi:hypothetical protein